MEGRPRERPIVITVSSFAKKPELDVKLHKLNRSQNWIVRETFAYRREGKAKELGHNLKDAEK
jgi:hypothetical protein